jgi:hypothetical protein
MWDTIGWRQFSASACVYCHEGYSPAPYFTRLRLRTPRAQGTGPHCKSPSTSRCCWCAPSKSALALLYRAAGTGLGRYPRSTAETALGGHRWIVTESRGR